MEREIKKREEHDDNPTEEIEADFIGAALYRSHEQKYYDFITASLNLKENPPPNRSVWEIDKRLYSLAAQASYEFQRMELYRRDYNLLIGGSYGTYKRGESLTFDPDAHHFEEDEERREPEKGEIVMVKMSAVSVMKEDQEEFLLAPVVALPPLDSD